MTRVLVLGTPPTQARLAKLLDAAVSRLGLTELATVAGSPADPMVTEWNCRRYRLVRYWEAEPVGDVCLVFPGWKGDLPGCERIIWC